MASDGAADDVGIALEPVSEAGAAAPAGASGDGDGGASGGGAAAGAGADGSSGAGAAASASAAPTGKELTAAERMLGLHMEAVENERVDVVATEWNMADVASAMSKFQGTKADPELMNKWRDLLSEFKELEGDLMALEMQFSQLDQKKDAIREFVETEGARVVAQAVKNNERIEGQDKDLEKQDDKINGLVEGQKNIGAPGFCVTASDTCLDSRGCLFFLLCLVLLLTAVCTFSVLKAFGVISFK